MSSTPHLDDKSQDVTTSHTADHDVNSGPPQQLQHHMGMPGFPPGFNPAMLAAYPQMMQAGYFNPAMMAFHQQMQMYGMAQGGMPLQPMPAKEASITVQEGTPIFQANSNGRTREPFPEKLYRMMMEAEMNDQTEIITFSGKGDTLVIMDKQRLQEEILPRYFKHAHWPSFQRQLYMYGFEKEPMGLEIYKHEGFVKGKPVRMRPSLQHSQQYYSTT